MHPLHHIGRALGATPGDSVCAVCGPSPFAVGRAASDALGPNFVDYDLIPGESADVCDGCARVLGGRPGDTPAPLRTGHFLVRGGELVRASIDDLRAALTSGDVDVIAWTASRQKHASLRCGPCGGGVLRMGTDSETLVWDVARDAPLLAAVETLRAAAKREQIEAGQYPPHVILALGAAWEPAEAVVSRYRPGLALDLALAVVRRPDVTLTTEATTMALDPALMDLGLMVDTLSRCSGARDADPIRYWSELLPRRLAAAASSQTMAEWLSYLVQSLSVAASRAEVVDVLAAVAAMTPEQEAAALAVARRDHRLIITAARLARQESA